jgi:tetratricopeptide (TPR) repeat protein
MVVCSESLTVNGGNTATHNAGAPWWKVFFGLVTAALLCISPACGQTQTLDWHAQVRKYAEAQDWPSAMRVVDQEIARAPQDTDVRAWRARVLAWSGRLAEAEREYLEILKVSRTDPDNWMGLAGVYLREGKVQQAQQAIDAAEELDPKRADLHAARARVLRAAGKRNDARLEFQKALNLDPTSTEAQAGLVSVRREPKHELRLGQDNDLLSYTSAYRDEWVSVASQWNSHWTASVAGDFYQRSGAEAGKFVGSITRRQPKWGALTVGGAVGHDNAVIPKSEAFFDLDHGWKAGETNFVRAVEFMYAQHWYWYQSSRILALNGGAIVYLPQEWTFSLAATGARSVFSGSSAEWRPSGISKLGFPLARWGDRRLSGNIFFAAGTENFAVVDQIGRFASQTYGGGLKFQIASRQDVTGYAGYQRRTQNRTDTSFGLSYGIHF